MVRGEISPMNCNVLMPGWKKKKKGIRPICHIFAPSVLTTVIFMFRSSRRHGGLFIAFSFYELVYSIHHCGVQLSTHRHDFCSSSQLLVSLVLSVLTKRGKDISGAHNSSGREFYLLFRVFFLVE